MEVVDGLLVAISSSLFVTCIIDSVEVGLRASNKGDLWTGNYRVKEHGDKYKPQST